MLGLALSAANPKNLGAHAGRGRRCRSPKPGSAPGDDAIAVAVFVVLGSITVVGSVLFYLFASEAAAKPLGAIKEFMSDHNAVIMMVILLMLGAKLIGDGLAGVTR